MKKLTTFIAILFLAVLAAAASNNSFSQGQGTAEDPFIVSNAQELDQVRNYPGAYFIQTEDISLTDFQVGLGWEPIGTIENPFTGHYNGNGYSISNLRITRQGEPYVGLFGFAGAKGSQKTVIKNITLENVTVIGGFATGALAGQIKGNHNTRIENSSVNNGIVRGDEAVGGLVGANNSFMENAVAAEAYRPGIYNSWANVDVSLRSAYAEGKERFGGLVGCNQKGLIANCYTLGSVSIEEGSKIGGLTGSNEYKGLIIDSYAAPAMETSECTLTGGLTGNNGTGRNAGEVIHSYWDMETTGIIQSDAGTPLNNNQMRQKSSFSNWDFHFTWQWEENNSYPTLKREEVQPVNFIWTGNAGQNWDDPGNWNRHKVPQSFASVTIPYGAKVTVPENNGFFVHDLEIQLGAELRLATGSILQVGGKLKGNGTTTGEGVLTLSGKNTQQIPAINFNNLAVNNHVYVQLTADATVNGTLEMQNGLLDLNGFVLTLGEEATLIEKDQETNTSRIFGEEGYIQTYRNLNAPKGNIAGLGIEIETGNNLGKTLIKRGHSEIAGTDKSQSILRWFEIEPANNQDLDATVIFHYSTGEMNLYDHDSNFILFESNKDRSQWMYTASEFNDTENTLTAKNINSLHTLTAGSAEIHLPVSLLSFEAKMKNQVVYIEWITASEINNHFFTVEKSANGIHFSDLVKVTGAGTTSSAMYYDATDKNPLRGTTYYRLKQTDFDGSYKYSDIIAVSNNNPIDSDAFRIYPNPAGSDNINIAASGEKDVNFNIFDLTGKKVYSGTAYAMTINNINIEMLAKGLYTVVFYGHENYTQKIQIK
ncbi:MAG: T9SS type A sorting domain-containing protein [Bacteroidales bacterium]